MCDVQSVVEQGYENAESKLKDEIIELKKQLAGQVVLTDSVQDFAIWLTGCGYDFTQHEYYTNHRYLFTASPSPELVAQFKADVVREAADKLFGEHPFDGQLEIIWLKEYADQILKEGE